MTQQEILAGFAEILDEIAGIAAADVDPREELHRRPRPRLADHGRGRHRGRGQVRRPIPDDNLKDLKTVRDAVDFIEKAGVAA